MGHRYLGSWDRPNLEAQRPYNNLAPTLDITRKRFDAIYPIKIQEPGLLVLASETVDHDKVAVISRGFVRI
jgi:hypothetical protein